MNLKNQDNVNYKDDLKNDDHLKNEDDPKNENNFSVWHDLPFKELLHIAVVFVALHQFFQNRLKCE